MARPRARLVDVLPHLAEQYSERNPEPFESLWAKPTPTLWWRCAAGHEFDETAATRAKVGKWKESDWRACPMCAGHRVEYRCGHQKRYSGPVNVEAAANEDCSTCVWERREAVWEDAVAAAKELAGQLPLDDVPAHLRPDLKMLRLRTLTEAWIDEHAHGEAGAVAAALEHLRGFDQSRLLPDVESLRRAAVAGKRVTVGGSAVWAPGLLYTTTGEAVARPLDVSRAKLVRVLRPVAARTSTKAITYAIRDWARSNGLEAAVEVTVPVENEVGRWGRVDLVLSDKAGRALVVEIDRTDKARSLAKLRHAKACGAAALWVRWGEGPFDRPHGIPTVVVR